MVFFNHATRQMTTKIVYYGPGLCGKTTNLNTIYGRTSQKARGEMVSLNTETDRTLFFDLLPLDVGMVGGFKTKLQLYTVPGQVFYNSTRKLVLKGVDGIVFVADSQVPMLDANKESLQNLSDNLKELGLNIGDIPMVFQWNKRDLKNVVPVPVLEAELNPKGHLSFQTIAQDGTGVFETLRGITRLALTQIKTLHLGDPGSGKVTMPVDLQAAPPEPVTESAPPALEPQEAAVPLQASDFAMPDSYGSSELPPLPEALSFLDLPSARDLFGEESSAPRVLPLPPEVHEPALPPAREPALPAVHGLAPHDAAPHVMAPMMVKLWPPQPKLQLKPLAPSAVVPKLQAATPRLLTMPNPLKVPSSAPVVRLTLPAGTGEGDLEVVVLLRQHGVTLTETTVHRPAPVQGSVSHLSVEIKGS